MKFVIVLLSFISIIYSQPKDTAGYKFDVILDSVINKATVEVNKEHSKEIKALTTVDSSTECDDCSHVEDLIYQVATH